MSLSTLADCDAVLVQAAKRVSVLGALSYPEATAEAFLAGWRRRRPVAPNRPDIKPVGDDVLAALRDVRDRVDVADPRGRFIHETADCYLQAAAMLGSAGTRDFHGHSTALYGSVGKPLPGSTLTHLEVAERLLEGTAALSEATREREYDYCLSAEHVALEMRRRLDAFFTEDHIKIVVDPDLSSKAAASARRIRLRGRTCFSPNDITQLVEHEAFVHSATALNGRKQPVLTSLSLGSPRTTATQEGLATFAELITGAMELARLQRIALRVRAVHVAEQGGGFIEVFRCFLEAGQTESESAHSAMRIFRGADPHGSHPFTKDVVYLRGIFAVHTFLRRAIVDVRPELIDRLFVGRLTLGDVLALEDAFDNGDIAPARYVPAWAQDVRALAAFLSFSAVIDRISLADVALADIASV